MTETLRTETQRNSLEGLITSYPDMNEWKDTLFITYDANLRILKYSSEAFVSNKRKIFDAISEYCYLRWHLHQINSAHSEPLKQLPQLTPYLAFNIGILVYTNAYECSEKCSEVRNYQNNTTISLLIDWDSRRQSLTIANSSPGNKQITNICLPEKQFGVQYR
uniref:Uncharacterized protein n=1 Tax=Glossina pallidipes TaxID=7398 RepID=A0A1A9Z4N1_GLOPL